MYSTGLSLVDWTQVLLSYELREKKQEILHLPIFDRFARIKLD